jgi:hypothetical protein
VGADGITVMSLFLSPHPTLLHPKGRSAAGNPIHFPLEWAQIQDNLRNAIGRETGWHGAT